MNCPACQVDLVMSERQGIEIDYCPKCRGVWLDRGELDKIIEKSAVEAAPAPRAPEPRYQEPQYRGAPLHQEPRYEQRRDEGYREGYKKPYRRKSWLEEIFD